MLSNSPRTPDQLSTGCCYSAVISSQRGMTIAHEAHQLMLTMECLSSCSCPRNKQGWGFLHWLWNCSYSLVKGGAQEILTRGSIHYSFLSFPALLHPAWVAGGLWNTNIYGMWKVWKMNGINSSILELPWVITDVGVISLVMQLSINHSCTSESPSTYSPTNSSSKLIDSRSWTWMTFLLWFVDHLVGKKKCFVVFFKKKWYKNMDFISDHEDHSLSRTVAWHTFERAQREQKRSSTKWIQIIPLWLLLKGWEHWSCSYKGRGDESKMKIPFIHCWTMSNGNESSDIRGSGKAGEEMSLSERK